MFRFGVVLLLMIWGHHGHADVTDGTELVLSLLIHRHGDRTPTESSLPYSTDPEALEKLSAPYGWGQLTKAGKRNAYKLGQSIKNRYGELIAPYYNRSEVFIRSTDVTRAKKTILSALAAIYPPTGERWNQELDWEPVPYTTVPMKYDFNLATSNCPAYINALNSIYMITNEDYSKKYSNVLNVISNQLGVNITSYPPIIVYTIFDVYASQKSLGLDLTPELEAIYDDIREASAEALSLVFSVEENIAYGSGVLLNEFFTYADVAIAGGDTPRLRIHSAHDINVYEFQTSTKVNQQGVPKYASAYALELRKVTSTGKHVVLPVYLPAPGENPVYLKVEGCGDLCDYNQFVNLTGGYARDLDTWRIECGFTEDIELDENAFN